MFTETAALFLGLLAAGRSLEPGIPVLNQWAENTFDHYAVSLPSLHRIIVAEHRWYTFLKENFLPEYGHQLVNKSRDVIVK